MKCPKCGKSLYKDNWYPMAARCMICGYWIERPTEAAMKFDRKLMVGTPRRQHKEGINEHHN